MKKQAKGLSAAEVKHVANLAKLKLTDEDLAKFRKQLTDIVDFVGKLQDVNTEDVEPTGQVTGLENVFRDDEVKPSLPKDEVLKNAKRKYKDYFMIDAIFDE